MRLIIGIYLWHDPKCLSRKNYNIRLLKNNKTVSVLVSFEEHRAGYKIERVIP